MLIGMGPPRTGGAHWQKLVKASVKQDEEQWLHTLVGRGRWKGVQHLRKGSKRSPARLLNVAGEVVASDARADTSATHLETWAVRPTNVCEPRPALGPERYQ